jgi:hypothetical protein
MQKIKSSLITRIWLSVTDSTQALRLMHHQMEWVPGPFLRGKKPCLEADAPPPVAVPLHHAS